MKKLILVLSTIVLGIFTLQSCKEDECVVETTDIKLDKTEVALTNIGATEMVKVVEGEGQLNVMAENPKIADATISGRMITVTAKSEGETMVTVTNTFKSATFKVKVTAPAFAIEEGKDKIALSIKGQQEIALVGGTAPYKVLSIDPADKATAEIKDRKVVITAKADNGKATITVTDANKKTATIEVTLKPAPELTFDKEKENYKKEKEGVIKFILGDTEANRTITITSGTPPYTIIQKDMSNYSDFLSTVENITLDKTEEIEKYGTKYKCKAGEFTGNTIVFNATEVLFSEEYIVRDATGKERNIFVTAINQLEVTKTEINVLVGQTVDDEVTVKGYIERVKIESNSNESVVEAKIADNTNESQRALILKGKAVGESTITITDGIVTKTVKVKVSEPAPMTIYKEDGTELDATTAYELGKFTIKGATGNFEVTTDSDKIKTPISVTQPWGSKDWTFTLNRNTSVAEGGEAIITVKNLDKPSEVKTFKVKCETLLELGLKVNNVAISTTDNGSGAYYSIADGMYPGYNIRGVKVNDVIEITVAKGSGDYKVDIDSYGADKLEVAQNGNNTTFTVTCKKAGTYYGDITITDKADATKVVKISRIYIE